MTIYSLDVLLSQFGTSLLFHVWLSVLLLDLHTDFSGGKSGGLVVPSFKEFSRKEYWNGLPFPSPGDLSNPGIEPMSLMSPHWQVGSLPVALSGKPKGVLSSHI